ncbi:hypothetical protein [Litorihabitans aurantiacus]|uniref:hypothetical protein n=1 Tax=Litorihabitans aurantiacus TaxID=1930061 RepID=UPI0024E0A48D|nr:hypothetical protein [Litorihabitans aurantiacus]
MRQEAPSRRRTSGGTSSSPTARWCGIPFSRANRAMRAWLRHRRCRSSAATRVAIPPTSRRMNVETAVPTSASEYSPSMRFMTTTKKKIAATAPPTIAPTLPGERRPRSIDRRQTSPCRPATASWRSRVTSRTRGRRRSASRRSVRASGVSSWGGTTAGLSTADPASGGTAASRTARSCVTGAPLLGDGPATSGLTPR